MDFSAFFYGLTDFHGNFLSKKIVSSARVRPSIRRIGEGTDQSPSLAVAILCVATSAVAFAGPGAEGANSNRGAYLSSGGFIIHPDEIKIEQYIAQRDYNYPLPEFGDLNVITASDEKQMKKDVR